MSAFAFARRWADGSVCWHQDRVDAPSVWKMDDPETLRKERKAKKDAADEAAKLKLKRKQDSKVPTLHSIRTSLVICQLAPLLSPG